MLGAEYLGVHRDTLRKLAAERPIPSEQARELGQTIAAAYEPYRTLFTVAALTGARLSELLGLTWANVRIDQVDDAEIEFACQVDRSGKLTPTMMTAEGRRPASRLSSASRVPIWNTWPARYWPARRRSRFPRSATAVSTECTAV